MNYSLSHKKKGFTIVELVIVIVVIAVLAAVLIPLFANLIEKAKLSVDQQTVDGMNKVLSADEVLSGKPKSLNAAKAVLESNNYRGNIAPTAKDHEFYWIPADNRVVLVKMNGDSPESIVYPKNLAEKYAGTLPTEWYKLSESSDVVICSHENRKYVAIADGNTSTAHMEICSECNTVTINSEAHDTAGANGACSKCGWKAPADGDSHVHAYTTVFLSDCNGHHYGVCSCGVLGPSEACAYDANGVCEKCHYAKPTTGDEHEHKFTYTPTSPYNGKHKKICTVEGCSISGAEENCAYGLNKKCIYCGADMPGQGGSEQHTHSYGEWTSNGDGTHSRSCSCGDEQTENCKYKNKVCTVCGYSKVRNGLVDGIYYKDDEPLTGTDKGYTFRDGYLVVKDTYEDSDITTESTPRGYSPVYSFLYNINHHITTPSDASVLTSSIYVGTTAEVLNWPFMHFKQQLSVENPQYKATRIQLTLPKLDDTAWNMDSTTLGNNIKGWDAADLRNYLSLVGDSEQSTIPYIIKCSDFTSYLTRNGLTVETYVSGYNAGSLSETYAQYLKSKYGEFSTWTISQAEALVNENGTPTNVRMVEPEVIELILKSFYVSTYKNTKIAVFKADGTTVVDAKMVGDCDGVNYKSYYSVEGYSALNSIEVSDGIYAVEILTIGVGDYFNGVNVCSPAMRICLKSK